MTAPGRAIAAFDFDGTLTRRDSLLPFLRDVAGDRALVRAALADLPRLALAAGGRADRDAAKARVFERVLAGRDYAEIQARGRDYGARLATIIRSEMRARLDWHRREGHETVIVSASLDVYLNEVARRIGVDHVVCTTLEIGPDGRLTGAMVGGNCRGPEKVARLRSRLDLGGATLWAYGDSAGDADLLDAADHAFRVAKHGAVRAERTG